MATAGYPNDLAILVLTRDILVQDNIWNAELPPDNSNDFLGGRCFVSGWGRTCEFSHVFYWFFFFFFNTIFVSSHMYPENPEGTQVIVGSMNMELF